MTKKGVIVTRDLEMRVGRKKRVVTVQLYRPMPAGDDYRCRYDVLLDGEVVRAVPGIYGIDGMQALLLAIAMLNTEVERIARDVGGKIEAWQLVDMRRLRPPWGATKPTLSMAKKARAKPARATMR